jgi:hypothetical protein
VERNLRPLLPPWQWPSLWTSIRAGLQAPDIPPSGHGPHPIQRCPNRRVVGAAFADSMTCQSLVHRFAEIEPSGYCPYRARHQRGAKTSQEVSHDIDVELTPSFWCGDGARIRHRRGDGICVVHACDIKSKGALALSTIKLERANRNETALQWSLRGFARSADPLEPQGSTGLAGPAGPQEPEGPTARVERVRTPPLIRPSPLPKGARR